MGGGGTLSSAICGRGRSTEREIEPPLDDVECAERVCLGGDAVEWGIEGEADVVYFLTEDGGDVAE